MFITARTNTPDTQSTDEQGRTVTTFHLKRACNGCSQLLGDIEDRDIDQHGEPTDVRAECGHCRALVELEMAGCRTWHLLPRDIGRIDDALDRDGMYAKGYWQVVDGTNMVVGLRIGTGESRLVARFGDWIVRHPDGRWSIHPAPAA